MFLRFAIEACLYKFLILAEPTPTNIALKSEPDILTKGKSDSPAMALANKVFLFQVDQIIMLL